MPLAYAAILGGTCTLIGTSTNIAVSGYLRKAGYGQLGMFELTPVGIVIALVGTLYMLFIGVRMLPDRGNSNDGAASRREYLAEVIILPTSPIVGQEVHSSDFAVMEFQVLRIHREGRDIEATPHELLKAGDVVLVIGKVHNLIRVKKIEGLDILADANLRASSIDMREAEIAEVVLTPTSALVGRSLNETKFRERSGLSILAIHRGDQSLLKQIGELPLHAGDVLLLQGPLERFRPFEENGEMVVLSRRHYSADTRRRGILLLIAFALAVALSTAGLLQMAVAMLIVAMFAVITRCISLETAYENIDWRLLILIGGMTAFGQAMTQSGAATLLAHAITGSLSSLGPHAVLAGFCLLTVALTQPMSNAAAALVVLPIALTAAEQMHMNPKSFGIAVMLSASVSLITPFEPSCILVFGPGRYRFSDFLKVGGGMSVLLVSVILWLVPYWWPL
jgi:di/tricarboxylate transporter